MSTDFRAEALKLAHQQMMQTSTPGSGIDIAEVLDRAAAYESYLSGTTVPVNPAPVGIIVVEAAARAAHEAIRILQIANDEPSVASPWATVEGGIKESCFVGVERVLADPDISNEDLHNLWIETKTSQGWVYGEEKNEELKTHPCMVPYEDLPPFQKLKDEMFRGIVKAVLNI